MLVKDLISELQKLRQDVEITVAGKPSHISYSNIEIEEICFDEEENEEDRWVEGYVIKPKECCT